MPYTSVSLKHVYINPLIYYFFKGEYKVLNFKRMKSCKMVYFPILHYPSRIQKVTRRGSITPSCWFMYSVMRLNAPLIRAAVRICKKYSTLCWIERSVTVRLCIVLTVAFTQIHRWCSAFTTSAVFSLYSFLVRVSNANQIFHAPWNGSTACATMVLETASDWVMVYVTMILTNQKAE